MSAHVVAFDKGIEGTAFRCEHCTLTYSPPMPMPLAKYVEQAKGFGLMHRGCEKPVAPSPQLRLPHHDYEVDPSGLLTDTEYLNGGLRVTEMRMGPYGPELPPGIPAPGYGPPEHDQPELTTYAEYETGHYAKFAQTYPAARDFTDLMVALGQALTLEQLKSLSAKHMVKLHPSSAEFQDIAHWARVFLARAEGAASAQRGEPGEGGITIPLLPPMPLPLQQALGIVPKKTAKAPKGGAQPKARKAKVAPAPNGSSA
jgi:hypothetical protein